MAAGNGPADRRQWMRINQAVAIFLVLTVLGLFVEGLEMMTLSYPGWGDMCGSGDPRLPVRAVISDPHDKITLTLVFSMIVAVLTALLVCIGWWWRNNDLDMVRGPSPSCPPPTGSSAFSCNPVTRFRAAKPCGALLWCPSEGGM